VFRLWRTWLVWRKFTHFRRNKGVNWFLSLSQTAYSANCWFDSPTVWRIFWFKFSGLSFGVKQWNCG
jgi:hypothetical protein